MRKIIFIIVFITICVFNFSEEIKKPFNNISVAMVDINVAESFLEDIQNGSRCYIYSTSALYSPAGTFYIITYSCVKEWIK